MSATNDPARPMLSVALVMMQVGTELYSSRWSVGPTSIGAEAKVTRRRRPVVGRSMGCRATKEAAVGT